MGGAALDGAHIDALLQPRDGSAAPAAVTGARESIAALDPRVDRAAVEVRVNPDGRWAVRAPGSVLWTVASRNPLQPPHPANDFWVTGQRWRGVNEAELSTTAHTAELADRVDAVRGVLEPEAAALSVRDAVRALDTAMDQGDQAATAELTRHARDAIDAAARAGADMVALAPEMDCPAGWALMDDAHTDQPVGDIDGAAMVANPMGPREMAEDLTPAELDQAADPAWGERDWRRERSAELTTLWAPHDLDRWLSDLADDPGVTDAEYSDAQAAVNSAVHDVHDDVAEGAEAADELGAGASTVGHLELDRVEAAVTCLGEEPITEESLASVGVSGEQYRALLEEADRSADVGDSAARAEQRPPLGSPGFLGRALEDLALEGGDLDHQEHDHGLADLADLAVPGEAATEQHATEQHAGRAESWRDPREAFGFAGPAAAGGGRGGDAAAEASGVGEAVRRADQAVHELRGRAAEHGPDRSGMGHWQAEQAEQARQAEMGGSADEDGSGMGRWV